MTILEMLNQLEDEIENASALPFTSKVILDKKVFFEIIRNIRINMPDELKQAQSIISERQKILIDAQKESEQILNQTEEHIKSMINQSEIVKKAEIQAQEILSNAKSSARQIRIGSKRYADQLLAKLENVLIELLSEIKQNRKELKE